MREESEKENKKSENYNNADGEYITIMIHRDIMNERDFLEKKSKNKSENSWRGH